MSMPETARQRAVRINLINSGLSPPIFILASFTDPPWELHEMNCLVDRRRLDTSNPSDRPVEYTFWGLFDIYPGVWLYKYRVGHGDWRSDDWRICDHQVEAVEDSSGEMYNVLRVEEMSPAWFESPAALPMQGSAQLPSLYSAPAALPMPSAQLSSLNSSLITNEYPNDYALPSISGGPNQISVDNSFSMSPLFSLSPTNVAEEGSGPSGNVPSNGEQPLLGHQNAEAIAQSRSHSDSKASVESKDQEALFTMCWRNFIAWIYILFAKVFGRFSNA